MSRYCRKCRNQIHTQSKIRPDWADGAEWKGWFWVPREQSVLRSTKNRLMQIYEDGDLVIDMHSDHRWDADVVEGLDISVALQIANLIAENDGGWGIDEDEVPT